MTGFLKRRQFLFQATGALMPVWMKCASADQNSKSDRLFGCIGLPSNNLASLPKWRAVARKCTWENTSETDRYLQALGISREEALKGDLCDRLRIINRVVNTVRYRSDASNQGVADYWAPPEEFLEKGGDCEDYAVLKYRLLRGLGWPPTSLRVVALRDRRKNVNHAVCIGYVDGNHYVLDSLINKVLTDEFFPTYQPVYAVNESGWWYFIRSGTYSS